LSNRWISNERESNCDNITTKKNFKEYFQFYKLLGNGVDAFGFVRSFGINGIWGLLSNLSINFNWGLGIFFVSWWFIENVFELRLCCCFNGRILSCRTNPS